MNSQLNPIRHVGEQHFKPLRAAMLDRVQEGFLQDTEGSDGDFEILELPPVCVVSILPVVVPPQDRVRDSRRN